MYLLMPAEQCAAVDICVAGHGHCLVQVLHKRVLVIG
jgi:hypothetical protein